MPLVRRLTAILAADVVGYSRLMGLDEAGTAQALREHRAAADPLITQHGGRIVKTTGDGVLIEFPSVVGAVECALALQKLAEERNSDLPGERRMEWRIGVHLGDVLIEGDDILGDGVNIAARLEGIAECGGICISEDAFRQVRGKVEVEFADCGEQSLKNIARPLRVYRVGSSSATRQPISPAAALPLPDKPSIAVLPFANMSGHPEQEYFADGMVEEIITALSRIRWLFVIARNSSFTYKGQSVDVKQVGRELGVRYVLEGSVRKAAGRVRITAQLIDATTGAHLWADRFDGALADVFDLQDQVAGAVTGVIEPTLQAAEIERARRKRTESLDAYDLYLRALAELQRPTEERCARALVLLEQAIGIDPSYSAAMAAAAFCFQRRKTYQWMTNEEAETAEGTKLARAAIVAARDDATVLANASFALWNLNGDAEAAVRTLDRAAELNPNLAIAWGYGGIVHAYAGSSAVAIERCARAMRLSPLDPSRWIFLFGTGIAHLSERRLDDAVVWLQRACEERPNFPTLLAFLASALAHIGRLEEARAMLHQLLAEPPQATVLLRRAPVFFKKAGVWVFILDGLRLAGLPEA